MKSIVQRIEIPADTMKVYDAFMAEKIHAEFTGMPAVIDHREGGKFLTCGTRNYGYTVFLKQGERIIQAWSHESFPDNNFTIVDIELQAKDNNSTILFFSQVGIPQSAKHWLEEGWMTIYWKPLIRYFEKRVHL